MIMCIGLFFFWFHGALIYLTFLLLCALRKAIPPETIFCPGETAPPFTSSTGIPAPTTLAPASAPLTSQPSPGFTRNETLSNSALPTLSETGTYQPSVGSTDLNSGAPSESPALPTTGGALSTSQPSLGSLASPTIAPSQGFAGSESTTPSTLSVASTNNPSLVASNVPPWALPADTESPTARVGTRSVIPTSSPISTPTQPTVTGMLFVVFTVY